MKISKPTSIRILAFLLFFSAGLMANGQDKELKGKVISASNGEILPYVSITIPKKGISTVSNDEGEFVFKFPNDYDSKDSILFSCIGYNSFSLNINDAFKQKGLRVTLTESVQALKEVVIKPLTIKQLLDSINHHNYMVFNSPMNLNGYYREFVFTNAKCTEYADALFEFHYDNTLKNNGQLKIAASRCEKAVQKNAEAHNYTAAIESKTDPDKMFSYAMLSEMIKVRFPDDQLDGYSYKIEEDGTSKDLRVIIYPKTGSNKEYKLQFILSADYILKSYKLEIPPELLKNVSERSMLGIHGKVLGLMIDARYQTNNGRTYPDYFRITKTVKIYGKFMGVVLDQITEQKSEFIVTQIVTKNIAPFSKNEVYRKGNICDNGIAMNDALLKNYNFILPTKKDSLSISSITSDISPDK